MIPERDEPRLQELGEFVRAHRERLTPAALGLPAGTRRRTPGLRREEVAQLGGLSTTWYTWIEQGRDVSASPAALARLAAVLRLERAERSYLFELAGKRDPQPPPEDAVEVPPAVQRCVERVDAPAYVLDRLWTAQAWNAPAARLFVGWLDRAGERNLLRYIFLQPAARTLICDWDARARRVAAEFRAASSAHLEDPALRGLLAGLRRESPAFARLWEQHAVLEREGGERTFNHPRQGFLRYEQVTFDLASRADLRMTVLVPMPGAKAKRRRRGA